MKKLPLLAVFILSLSLSAAAYTRIAVNTGTGVLSPRWATMPIRYAVNARGLSTIANGSEFNAVHASFQTWQDVPTAGIRFDNRGTTETRSLGFDGINLITFADDETVLGSTTLAATFSFFGPGAQTIEADILFNTGFEWTTSGEPGKYDIQAVLTHEVGHLLGLDHSGLVSSVMVPFAASGQIDQRVLQYDDIAGVTELYPAPGVLEQTGEIRGVIRSASGPVFGGHVVAVDREGTSILSTVSHQDGSYVLRVNPGEYRVYAEPLDSPVTEENLGGYYVELDTDFGATFAGDVSNLGLASTLSVGAGQTLSADINVFPRSATNLNVTRPGFAPRVPRGAFGVLTLGGVDLSQGVSFSSSSPAITLEPPVFGTGGTSATPTIASLPLTVSPETPLGPKVIAANRGTDSAIISGVIVVIEPPPSEISFQPAFGPAVGGTDLTIRGRNFRRGAKVYFYGIQAPQAEVLSSTEIRVRTPANIPGAANVQVINSDGTGAVARQPFTYASSPPEIQRVSPLIGPPTSTVVIDGANFDSRAENVQVSFNGVAARILDSTSTSIRVIVPFGATTGPISVSVFGQRVLGPVFTVTEIPVSTNIAPTTFEFIDGSASGRGEVLNFFSNDDAIAQVDLPFNFNLFRDIYPAGSRISIATNGWLSLETVAIPEYVNGPLPGSSVPRPGGGVVSTPPALIAPFFDDLIIRPGVSTVVTQTLGSAPSRRFVVQWSHMGILDDVGRDSGADITFQAVLFEGSGDIQFLYSSLTGPGSTGSGATVGIQDSQRVLGIQTSYNRPVLRPGYLVTYRFHNGDYQVSAGLAEFTSLPHRQYVPYAPQNSSHFSGLAMVAPTAMSVVVRAVDANGRLVSAPGVVNPIAIDLGAGQQSAQLLSELFGFVDFRGWIEIESSSPDLVAFATTGTWSMTELDGAAPVELSSEFVAIRPGATVVIANPWPRSVLLERYSGSLSTYYSIPARGQIEVPVSAAFRFRATEKLAAVERSTANGRSAIAPVQSAANAQGSFVFPQAVVGAGYSSLLTVSNVGVAGLELTVSFGGISRSLGLNANSTQTISIDQFLQISTADLRTGALEVSTASGGVFLAALEVSTSGSSVWLTSRPASTQAYIPNLVNSPLLRTGVSISNTNVSTTVTIEVYRSTGERTGSTTIALVPNEHVARSVDQLVAGVESGGYVRIRSNNPVWVVGIYHSPAVMAAASAP